MPSVCRTLSAAMRLRGCSQVLCASSQSVPEVMLALAAHPRKDIGARRGDQCVRWSDVEEKVKRHQIFPCSP